MIGTRLAFEHLIEHRVRAVAGVDQDAEPVHLGHPLPAERRQAVPARRVGGAVAELVVAEVDRPGEPDAEPVEGGEQGQILAERPAILHADEREMLARAGQAQGIVGGHSEADPAAILAEHAADRGGADQSRVARRAIAFGGQRALRRVDDEKAAIEAAFVHPRQIDLAAVLAMLVAHAEIPLAVVPALRDVEMGVDHDHALVRGAVGRAQFGPLRRGGNGEEQGRERGRTGSAWAKLRRRDFYL